MVPKPDPRQIHRCEISLVRGFVNTAKNAATDDGDGDGEDYQTEDGAEKQLLAPADSDFPEDGQGEAENCDQFGHVSES